MPRVLIAGCGDLGAAVGRQLTARGVAVSAMRRNAASVPPELHAVAGDVTRPETLSGLAGLAPDILIYSVSADAQSDHSYRAHYVDGLRHVLDALHGAASLRHVFFVSSTRVYGQPGDALLDEDEAPLPADFGSERLLEGERLLSQYPFSHTVLRLSGIYGPGRRWLLNMAADPSRWPPHNTWSNRIHRDDAAAFMAFLTMKVLGGEQVDDCYIVTDDCPVPQHEVLRWLAGRLGVEADRVESPLPAGGKRLSNARLRGTGFELQYPDYRAGYATLLP